MPIINFKEQFVKKILSGEKCQTIRLKRRKNKIKKGDILYLYTGLRTKNCKKICEKECTGVYGCGIGIVGDTGYFELFDDGIDVKSVYENDGFDSLVEMCNFLKNLYGLPFYGEIITWR